MNPQRPPEAGWLARVLFLSSARQPRVGGPCELGPLWGGGQDRVRAGGACVRGVTRGLRGSSVSILVFPSDSPYAQPSPSPPLASPGLSFFPLILPALPFPVSHPPWPSFSWPFSASVFPSEHPCPFLCLSSLSFPVCSSPFSVPLPLPPAMFPTPYFPTRPPPPFPSPPPSPCLAVPSFP